MILGCVITLVAERINLIFYWLTKLLRGFLWLFRAPTPRDVARIWPDSPCPVCGARHGRLRARDIWDSQKRERMLCQHTCLECGARYFEAPVVAFKSGLVWGSLPRDEEEKAEDRTQLANRERVAEEQRGVN